MKILIDIGHTAQLNFYLNAIKILSANHEILITYIKRGKLPQIIEKELGSEANINTLCIGFHRGTRLSILLEGNLIRILKLVWITYKFKPDIEFSNGYMAAIGPKIFGIPTCHFQDDPEIGKLRMWLMRFFADKIYIPFYPESKKIKSMRGLKEWAYLSPKYFCPNPSILSEHNLNEKEYIFVREVITSTFNYQGQEKTIIESLAKDFSSNIQVVLSLENKSRAKYFPARWKILVEPVQNIHSLIYYSKAVISSGDSMAREGAQLGLPSIYCGFRKMHSNDILIKEGILLHKKKTEVIPALDDIINGSCNFKQEAIRIKLESNWDDITNLIVGEVKKLT